MEKDKNLYSIQMASKLSGVGVHTIRAWEKRYQAVVPLRTSTGRRQYSKENVHKLKLLSDLCTLGNSIGNMAHLPIDDLESMIGQVNEHYTPVNKELARSSYIGPEDSLDKLLMALQFYKLDVIGHELEKLKIALSPKDMALKIVSPLLYEVGVKVENGTLSISQEHALSSILKFHIGHYLFHVSNSGSLSTEKIIIAGIEGDYHEFGIIMAALICSEYRLKYYYLGPNLPAISLIDAFKSLEATTIILGGTSVLDTQKEVGHTDKYLTTVTDALGPKQKFIFGGNATYNRRPFSNIDNFIHFTDLNGLDAYLSKAI